MSLAFSICHTYSCHCGFDLRSHQCRIEKEEIPGQARNDKEMISGGGKQSALIGSLMVRK